MNRKDRGALHSLAVFDTEKKNVEDRKHINKKEKKFVFLGFVCFGFLFCFFVFLIRRK